MQLEKFAHSNIRSGVSMHALAVVDTGCLLLSICSTLNDITELMAQAPSARKKMIFALQSLRQRTKATPVTPPKKDGATK